LTSGYSFFHCAAMPGPPLLGQRIGIEDVVIRVEDGDGLTAARGGTSRAAARGQPGGPDKERADDNYPAELLCLLCLIIVDSLLGRSGVPQERQG